MLNRYVLEIKNGKLDIKLYVYGCSKEQVAVKIASNEDIDTVALLNDKKTYIRLVLSN